MRRCASCTFDGSWALRCCAATLLVAGLVSCAAQRGSESVLRAEDFVARDAASARGVAEPASGTPGARPPTVGVAQGPAARPWTPVARLSRSQGFSPELGPRGAYDLDVTVDRMRVGRPEPGTEQPEWESAEPRTPGARLIDAKVGEINGESVFVSSILDEAMLARIEREAPGDRPAWRQYVRARVRERLSSRVNDVLLRERARSLLPQEQRQGLFAFLDRVRAAELARAGGSATLANQRLMEREGQSLDEFVARTESVELLNFLFEPLRTRSRVPSVEVEREYERANQRSRVFNPDPVGVYVLALLRAGHESEAARLESMLRAGEPFEKVYQDPSNLYAGDDAGRFRRGIPGDRAQAEIFADDVINEAARGVDVGGWRGPLKRADGRVVFVHLQSIEDNSMSLYEAQYYLASSLQQRRLDDEVGRLIDELRREANFTDEAVMVEQIALAAERMFFGVAQADTAGPMPGASEPQRQPASESGQPR